MNNNAVDVAKTWLINGTVLGAVTVAQVEAWLKVAVLAATLGYTLWKWSRDANLK